ncbi:MAG TPA: hypothetical protein PL128_08160 [Ginsengibacter sp.]|nr:hypothetical protein [Ginsengibacter sp.]
METITYHEVLIAPNSQFFSKEFHYRQPYSEISGMSNKDKLAEACWGGLLKEMLPEVCPDLELKEIDEGNKFLNLRMGRRSKEHSICYSINPYYFLNHVRKN